MGESAQKMKTTWNRWWTTAISEKRPEPNPARMVTVDELPVYAEDSTPHYQYVKDRPLLMQEEVSAVRRAAMQRYDSLEGRLQTLGDRSKKIVSYSSEVKRRLLEDYGELPKAAAITVGGLTGFLFALKKSVFRRFLYSGVGILTMTALCYPYETIAFVRTGVEHTQIAWNDFKRSPEPPDYTPPGQLPKESDE